MTRAWMFAWFLLVFTGCERGGRLAVLTGESMGTTWRVKATGDPERLRPRMDEVLQRLDRDLSTWREDSWLSRFNRSPAGVTMEMPEDVARLLEVSVRCHRQTGGRFDPTIGALIRVWGFGAWRGDWRGEPEQRAVELAREACGFRHIRWNGRTITKLHGGLMLDFSAVAKGYAVDRLADILREAGHADFVVEFGGDLLASGNAPGKSGWIVQGPAWSEPRSLVNQAVATSGSEHQFRGNRSHIIDPFRGMPVPVGRPASAMAATCAEADALATAKVVEESGR